MQFLESLVTAGFTRSGDGQGMDRTVSGLDWAIQNHQLGSTCAAYASEAASNLEQRLFAAYIVHTLSFIRMGKFDEAHREFAKARAVVAMMGERARHNECIAEAMAFVDRLL